MTQPIRVPQEVVERWSRIFRLINVPRTSRCFVSSVRLYLQILTDILVIVVERDRRVYLIMDGMLGMKFYSVVQEYQDIREI